MISDLDETLRQLLMAEIPVKNGEIEISFDQPKREWSSRLTRPTVNLFLYDVRENPTLRQHGWELAENGRPALSTVQMKRTPFRVDCFYMLTTWAAEPEDEHRLLTRAMLALFRNPVLPVERLYGGLKNQPFDIPAYLATHDRLTNPAELWASLDNEIRPSVSYLLTLALDPWVEITGSIVRTLTFRMGQAARLPRSQGLQVAEIDRTFIGGTVLSKGSEKKPLAGVDVAVKGTGLFDRTDDQGRFTLGSLPPGEYTLVVWTSAGAPKEKRIQVPAGDGNYDMEY